MPVSKYSQGFTLIEIIISLMVLGVISLGIGSYLQLGAQGYIQNRDREQLQSQARFAAERISRELRHAVPNSLTVSSDKKCITFTPIEYAGFYTSQTLEEIDTLEGVMSSSVEWKRLRQPSAAGGFTRETWPGSRPRDISPSSTASRT